MLTKVPHLPPELEHEIFVLAFQNTESIADKPQFLRISKRVTEWLIPVFYNVVIIWDGTSNPKYPPLSTLQKYGHHIRHLLVKKDTSLNLTYESELLSCCQKVVNLALWYGTVPSSNLIDLSLQKLALVRLDFVINRVRLGLDVLELPRWCSSITHLAVGDVIRYRNIEILKQFSALEYLMVLTYSTYDEFLNRILTCCPQLKALIRSLGLVSNSHETQVAHDEEKEGEDIRIVHLDGLFVEDWIRGRDGLGDVWSIAEKEMKRRRGGG